MISKALRLKGYMPRIKKQTISSTAVSNDILKWKNYDKTFSKIDQFNIITFNMLAPCYKRVVLGNNMKSRESVDEIKWNVRAKASLDFLLNEICPTATIIALQEFWLYDDYYTLFQQGFESKGYELRYLRRTGEKSDAVAFVIRKGIFDILGTENIYLCSQGDRVALLVWLKHRMTGKHILIANTHLSFPHSIFDKMNQVRQMQTLTENMDKYTKRYNITQAANIILGDFNVEHKSPVCDHLKDSGYYSCFEVCPPGEDLDTLTITTTIPSSTSINNDNKKHDIVVNTTINNNSRQYNGMKVDDDIGESTIEKYKLPSEYHSTDPIHVCDITQKKQVEKLIHSHPINESDKPLSSLTSSTGTIDSHTLHVQKALEAFRKQKKTHHYGLQFVSHFNHQQEAVGVDHIFLKPELIIHKQLYNEQYHSYHNNDHNILYESLVTSSQSLKRMSKRPLDLPLDSPTPSESDNSHSSNHIDNNSNSGNHDTHSKRLHVISTSDLLSHHDSTTTTSSSTTTTTINQDNVLSTGKILESGTTVISEGDICAIQENKENLTQPKDYYSIDGGADNDNETSMDINNATDSIADQNNNNNSSIHNSGDSHTAAMSTISSTEQRLKSIDEMTIDDMLSMPYHGSRYTQQQSSSVTTTSTEVMTSSSSSSSSFLKSTLPDNTHTTTINSGIRPSITSTTATETDIRDNQSLVGTSSSSTSASITTVDQSNIIELPQFSIFIMKSEVLPTGLDYRKWPTCFELSDHRPVCVSLMIASKNK